MSSLGEQNVNTMQASIHGVMAGSSCNVKYNMVRIT